MVGGLSSSIHNAFQQSFINRCIFILVEGLQSVKESKSYEVDWPEEKISAHLVYHMDKLSITNQWMIDIIPEPRHYNDDFYSGKEDPATAPRLDIRMCFWKKTWSQNIKLTYIIEAKNLSEKDWVKSSGAKVSASAQKKRYITTGIDNFLNSRYPLGCLVGYVVEGDPEKIVADINSILVNSSPSRSNEIMRDKEDALSCPLCFTSHHSINNDETLALKHFLLKM